MKHIIFFLLLILFIGNSYSQTKSDSISILYKRINNAGTMLQKYYTTRNNGLIKFYTGSLGTVGFGMASYYSGNQLNKNLFAVFSGASFVVSILGTVDLFRSHTYIKKAGFYLSPNSTNLTLGYRF